MTTGAPPEPERHLWSHVFSIVMMIVGAIALAFMLRTTTWAELRAPMVGVGMWAALIIAIDVAAVCCDAKALHSFMQPEARMVSYLRVLGAQGSGRAINVLTPFGALGEATKLSLLMSHAPRARIISSILLLNIAMLYINVFVMVVGIPITLLLVDLPDYLKVMTFIGLAVLVPAMVALGVIIHRGALSTLVGMMRHVRLIKAERAKTWKSKLVEIDKHIRELQRSPTAGTRTGILFVLVSRCMSWTATVCLMHAIGISLTPSLVIGVLSVGMLVSWISSIVPLGLGIADGGNYALYGLLGATGQHGVVITMLNRARQVAVAMIGLGGMAALQLAGRITTFRIRRKLRRMKHEHDQAAAP